jgi:hypothetical protein
VSDRVLQSAVRAAKSQRHKHGGPCRNGRPAHASADDGREGGGRLGIEAAAMTAPRDQTGDPLHGVTLERMLNELVEHFGWEAMGKRIAIRCFTSDPSVSSSLRFLRKTPWAREKVEGIYLSMLRERARQVRRLQPGKVPSPEPVDP